MKCDAGIHEETCTHVVLSGNTIMFQSFGEFSSSWNSFADMGSGLAKHLGTMYDAAVKDVSVRMQAAKARTAVYAVSQDDRRESHDSIEL